MPLAGMAASSYTIVSKQLNSLVELVEKIMNKLVMNMGKRPSTSVLTIAAVVLASIVSAKIFGMVSTLLILSALITLHEFGHWIVARVSGIDVPVFSVGLGSANQ